MTRTTCRFVGPSKVEVARYKISGIATTSMCPLRTFTRLPHRTDDGVHPFGRADSVPVALLNMSDWRAAEAAVSDPPCAPFLPRYRIHCASGRSVCLGCRPLLAMLRHEDGGVLCSHQAAVEVLSLLLPPRAIHLIVWQSPWQPLYRAKKDLRFRQSKSLRMRPCE